LSIESDENNCYLIRESVLKEEEIVSSREDAVKFVLSLGESIEEQFAETVDREIGDIENQESVREDLLSSYRKALNINHKVQSTGFQPVSFS